MPSLINSALNALNCCNADDIDNAEQTEQHHNVGNTAVTGGRANYASPGATTSPMPAQFNLQQRSEINARRASEGSNHAASLRNAYSASHTNMPPAMPEELVQPGSPDIRQPSEEGTETSSVSTIIQTILDEDTGAQQHAATLRSTTALLDASETQASLDAAARRDANTRTVTRDPIAPEPSQETSPTGLKFQMIWARNDKNEPVRCRNGDIPVTTSRLDQMADLIRVLDQPTAYKIDFIDAAGKSATELRVFEPKLMEAQQAIRAQQSQGAIDPKSVSIGSMLVRKEIIPSSQSHGFALQQGMHPQHAGSLEKHGNPLSFHALMCVHIDEEGTRWYAEHRGGIGTPNEQDGTDVMRGLVQHVQEGDYDVWQPLDEARALVQAAVLRSTAAPRGMEVKVKRDEQGNIMREPRKATVMTTDKNGKKVPVLLFKPDGSPDMHWVAPPRVAACYKDDVYDAKGLLMHKKGEVVLMGGAPVYEVKKDEETGLPMEGKYEQKVKTRLVRKRVAKTTEDANGNIVPVREGGRIQYHDINWDKRDEELDESEYVMDAVIEMRSDGQPSLTMSAGGKNDALNLNHFITSDYSKSDLSSTNSNKKDFIDNTNETARTAYFKTILSGLNETGQLWPSMKDGNGNNKKALAPSVFDHRYGKLRERAAGMTCVTLLTYAGIYVDAMKVIEMKLQDDIWASYKQHQYGKDRAELMLTRSGRMPADVDAYLKREKLSAYSAKVLNESELKTRYETPRASQALEAYQQETADAVKQHRKPVSKDAFVAARREQYAAELRTATPDIDEETITQRFNTSQQAQDQALCDAETNLQEYSRQGFMSERRQEFYDHASVNDPDLKELYASKKRLLMPSVADLRKGIFDPSENFFAPLRGKDKDGKVLHTLSELLNPPGTSPVTLDAVLKANEGLEYTLRPGMLMINSSNVGLKELAYKSAETVSDFDPKTGETLVSEGWLSGELRNNNEDSKERQDRVHVIPTTNALTATQTRTLSDNGSTEDVAAKVA